MDGRCLLITLTPDWADKTIRCKTTLAAQSCTTNKNKSDKFNLRPRRLKQHIILNELTFTRLEFCNKTLN